MNIEARILEEILAVLSSQKENTTNNIKGALPENSFKDDWLNSDIQVDSMVSVGKLKKLPFAFQGMGDVNDIWTLNPTQDMDGWNGISMSALMSKKVQMYYGRFQFAGPTGASSRNIFVWDSIANIWRIREWNQDAFQFNMLFADFKVSDVSKEFALFQGLKLAI